MNIVIIKETLLYSLIPLITMIIGGVWSANFKVGDKMQSTILHLAAGVIFAVVAVEILPDIVEKGSITNISVGFFAGLGTMLLIKHFSHKAEEKHKLQVTKYTEIGKKLLPWALIIGIAVDIFIDGILLGVGFAAGQSEGILLCAALSLEILVLGLVVGTELKNENFSKNRILTIISVTALTFVVGAFLGSVMLSIVSEEVLTYILAFGLSALIYLVTEELLVEAHEKKDTPLNTAIFFVGFFIFFIISIISK